MAKITATDIHTGAAPATTSFQINVKGPTSYGVRYTFSTHFHPYVKELRERLLEGSIRRLLGADDDYVREFPDGPQKLDAAGKPIPTLRDEKFFADYQPNEDLVQKPHPAKDLDFHPAGAYSFYNWELFYHVPLTIAIHLSKNQRFEEARRWLHYIFDPTDSSPDPSPARYFRVRPFRDEDAPLIQEIMVNLAKGTDSQLKQDTLDAIEQWKKHPFRPHRVAYYRSSAYKIKAVTAYLDNLIDWGDSLFRQDTGEAIDEALQLYILAANILGPRPQRVPDKGKKKASTYAELKTNLDAFSNALVDLEALAPFCFGQPPSGSGAEMKPLENLGSALYFCVPRNDKLLGYWDTVADRLFKIRNSLNFQGRFRQLALFDPPIDPGLLAKAAASGLDVGAILAGLNQPLPLVRYSVLAQRAMEICQELKSLGGHLLAAIEKEDGERLALLRAEHESVLLGLGQAVKLAQWKEAEKAREGIEQTLANAIQRYTYYELQLGKESGDIQIPSMDPLDVGALFDTKLRAREPTMPLHAIPVDIAKQPPTEAGGKIVSSHEASELGDLKEAQDFTMAATAAELAGAYLGLMPEMELAAKPVGAGAAVEFGGRELSTFGSMAANVLKSFAGAATYRANLAAKVGSFARREQEWAFQSNTAATEITQILKQLRGAQIREAVAERELSNHQKQMEQSAAVHAFLKDDRKGKRTNVDFYAWMKREARGLYAKCYDLAFDVAKKAERALQHELGDPTLTFVEPGHMAGKEGLFAGEKLWFDLKRMDLAYLEQNRRELELTKHVSLREIAPEQLLLLRATGECSLSLKEVHFDLDAPGHYFRRIKAVALSIPCVTGPYTGVHASLSLEKSKVRTSAVVPGDGYGDEDEQFNLYFGGVDAVVTSSAQSDGGMFEVNLRDERVLPFEGQGAIGSWRIKLPADLRRFDYGTISDVVLHVRYTARDGGEPLLKAAQKRLKTSAAAGDPAVCTRLLRLREDLPEAWSAFVRAPAAAKALSLTIGSDQLPFWARSEAIEKLSAVRWYFQTAAESGSLKLGKNESVTLEKADKPGILEAGVEDPKVKFKEPFTVSPDIPVEDAWIQFIWHGQFGE